MKLTKQPACALLQTQSHPLDTLGGAAPPKHMHAPAAGTVQRPPPHRASAIRRRRRRAQFLLESVAALQGSLRDIGSDLVVAVGKPEEIIPGG